MAGITLANIRNRAEQSQLNAELHRLEREKKNALRMHNTEEQRFRSKYSNLTLSSNEASKMYEAYNPGFYYRRNGEQKSNQPVQSSSSIDFKHIHNLLFTKEEVDIEKVMCLHLISAHRTETLTPPKKKMKYMCKEHSPSEKILERSKKGNVIIEKLSNILPLYSVELEEYGAMGENADPLINDGRLTARILVNEKVTQLVNSVISALEQSNKEKLQQLLDMAGNTHLLKNMLGKKYINEFLGILSNHILINSSESFVLTPPFKIKAKPLSIKTPPKLLESLIKQIRQNVLQLPTRSHLKKVIENNYEVILHPRNISNLSLTKMQRSKIPDNSPRSSKNSSNLDMLYTRRDSSKRSTDEVKRGGRYKTINFIAKNIEAAAKAKRIEYDTEENDILPFKRISTDSSRSRRKSSATSNVIKLNVQTTLQTTHENESSSKEIEKKVSKGETGKKGLSESNKETEKENATFSNRKLGSRGNESVKYHIKQTTCPACMEKWKTPLPSPKTPRVKQSSVLPPRDNTVLKTNSHNRLSMLINKEMYKLESYDRKYSTDSNTSRRSSVKKKDVEADSAENVNLNPIDLAKIEQEIREQETRKKLEKFLEVT